MNIASGSSEETVTSLKRRIAEAEMRSTAADALVSLTKTEAETGEAERRLWDEMDALLALRRQLWKFRFPESV